MKELDDLGDIRYSETGTESWTMQLFRVLEALIERINDKADKQVANDNVLRDMEQHKAMGKRITALENSVGAGLAELPLSDEVAGLSGEFARMTEERNKLWKRITALEADRDTAFTCFCAECAERETCNRTAWGGRVKPECFKDNTAPLPCCEECAEWGVCHHPPREWLIPAGKSAPFECYRESHTCGKCKKVRLSVHYRGLGSCPQCAVLHKDDESCGEFEAVK